MPIYALVHFPKINTEAINALRTQSDPYRELIDAHITIVFPVQVERSSFEKHIFWEREAMYKQVMSSVAAMLFLVVLGTTSRAADDGRVLFDFSTPDAAKAWVNVNDGVMGGVSDGRYRIAENKTMEFYGTLSLENNGGFASVRSRPTKVNLKAGDSVAFRVRGDGREYSFNLYVSRDSGRYSFRQTFKTKQGEWIQVSLPVDTFYATWRGRKFPDQELDPSRVNSVGFLLGDKQTGPFKLEVDWIKVCKAE